MHGIPAQPIYGEMRKVCVERFGNRQHFNRNGLSWHHIFDDANGTTLLLVSSRAVVVIVIWVKCCNSTENGVLPF